MWCGGPWSGLDLDHSSGGNSFWINHRLSYQLENFYCPAVGPFLFQCCLLLAFVSAILLLLTDHIAKILPDMPDLSHCDSLMNITIHGPSRCVQFESSIKKGLNWSSRPCCLQVRLDMFSFAIALVFLRGNCLKCTNKVYYNAHVS